MRKDSKGNPGHRECLLDSCGSAHTHQKEYYLPLKYFFKNIKIVFQLNTSIKKLNLDNFETL